MEGEGESSASVYVRQPLLETDLQDDINVKFVQQGDASFAKTPFNGLNALSGF